MTRVGDIVVSNINAVNRATCVIPAGLDGLLASNEFTVLRLKPGVTADPQYIWSVLRDRRAGHPEVMKRVTGRLFPSESRAVQTRVS